MYQLKDKDLQALYMKIDPKFLQKLNTKYPSKEGEVNGKTVYSMEIGKKLNPKEGKYSYRNAIIYYTEDDLEKLPDINLEGWNYWKEGLKVPDLTYACEIYNPQEGLCKAVCFVKNGQWNISDQFQLIRFRCWE